MRVVLGLAIVLRSAPEGRDQTLVLEPMQSGVKRTVFDLQDFFRRTFDHVGDRVPVGGRHNERLENQHVQGALQHVAPGVGPCLLCHSEIEHTRR